MPKKLTEAQRLRVALEDKGRDLACVARESCYALEAAASALIEDPSDQKQTREDLLAVIFFWHDVLEMQGMHLTQALADFEEESRKDV